MLLVDLDKEQDHSINNAVFKESLTYNPGVSQLYFASRSFFVCKLCCIIVYIYSCTPAIKN